MVAKLKILTVDVLNKEFLIHERQLGDQLGECVHQKRRSDFSFMLAMLTDDVTAHSQFKHPQTQQEESLITNDSLRQNFHLPAQAPLALDDLSAIADFNQATLIQDQSLEQIKLANALSPKALAFRDDAQHIPQQVMENTSLYCQYKHLKSPSIKRDEFNANAWLSAVNTARVKSELIAEYA